MARNTPQGKGPHEEGFFRHALRVAKQALSRDNIGAIIPTIRDALADATEVDANRERERMATFQKTAGVEEDSSLSKKEKSRVVNIKFKKRIDQILSEKGDIIKSKLPIGHAIRSNLMNRDEFKHIQFQYFDVILIHEEDDSVTVNLESADFDHSKMEFSEFAFHLGYFDYNVDGLMDIIEQEINKMLASIS